VKQGKKPDILTRMPEDIPPRWDAEKPLQIMIKTDNINNELSNTLLKVFAETVNRENDETCTDVLWKWVTWLCQECMYHSCEGQSTHKKQPFEISTHGSYQDIMPSSSGFRNTLIFQLQDIQDN
jgi:hypothetical protein